MRQYVFVQYVLGRHGKLDNTRSQLSKKRSKKDAKIKKRGKAQSVEIWNLEATNTFWRLKKPKRFFFHCCYLAAPGRCAALSPNFRIIAV